MNLREHVATDGLKLSMEGNFGLPVVLIDPDGATIDTNEDDDTLKGQVLYDRIAEDPETGDEIVINEVQISIRKTALSRVPKKGETWKIAFPLDPSDPDTLTTHLLSKNRAPIGGSSVGFVKLFPGDVDQS